MPKVGTIWTFDYTGGEQVFKVPVSGIYKLETWGAQGGEYISIGGYGGYSIGNIFLKRNVFMYINVGEKGQNSTINNLTATYNGGGGALIQSTHTNVRYFSSGGGATHVATISGLLSKLENSKENILIVSGGGGGSYYQTSPEQIVNGGSAGGYIGLNGSQITVGWGSFGYGGSQAAGGYSLCDDITCSSNKWERKKYSVGGFGYGGSASEEDYLPSSGGGGGWYGGGGSGHVQSAGGGSGYIGNSLLTNKAMYCYNCSESSEESTKTISTTCVSDTPTSNCSKKGNGYAKITLISY